MTTGPDRALIAALADATGGHVATDVPLAPLSRWRIGGLARIYVEPSSAEEAAAVMAIMHGRPEPLFLMGDSSNTLFDSAGFDGVVVRIGRRMANMRLEGAQAWAQAGIWVPRFARRIGCSGLTGIEHTIGIPGTLGGLILMNGGSQRKGIGLNVVSVRCADSEGRLFELTHSECGFAYRSSTLQGQRTAILEARLEFERGDSAAIRREMLGILRSRRLKFPQKLPNCGSTFLSDPKMYSSVGPPGQALESAGLKGLRRGDAQISPMHANFIVNHGNASSSDVLWLIAHARNLVEQRTGYAMDCEVRHLAPDGALRPAHEPALHLFANQ
ncbi:UDP-N-acetylmuramate dehydrogenase [Luteimonas sp. gir]|uniref:UDP-N-acetylmuramate dehydrogenase n=1 Tax=Luteimonas sp. gir TaxID=3127960 RepID=UPI003075D652